MISPSDLQPRDIWNQIFNKLDMTGFKNASRICKKWHSYLLQEVFRKQLYESSWGEPIPYSLRKSQSWKQIVDASNMIYLNIVNHNSSGFAFETPGLQSQTGALTKIKNLELHGTLFTGAFRVGKPLVWNLQGKLLYRFPYSVKILDVNSYQVLFYDRRLPSVLQLRDMRRSSVRFIFKPEELFIKSSLKACLNPCGKVIAPFYRIENDKYRIEIMAINSEKADCAWERASSDDFICVKEEGKLDDLFRRLIITCDHDASPLSFCIPEGEVQDYKVWNGLLAIIAKERQEDGKEWAVYLFDLASKTVTKRKTPGVKACSIGEHTLVEYDHSRKAIQLVCLPSGRVFRNLDLNVLLHSYAATITKIKACYAKQHLFLLIKEEETYDLLLKVNLKNNTIKNIFPRHLFFPVQELQAPAGPESAGIKWMDNRLVFVYRKHTLEGFLDEGVFVYDYTVKRQILI